VQVLQASVTGLEPKQPYVLALSAMQRRHLVIAPGTAAAPGAAVQIQATGDVSASHASN
jgi:hypothetical protein